jgi:hypothetical protein
VAFLGLVIRLVQSAFQTDGIALIEHFNWPQPYQQQQQQHQHPHKKSNFGTVFITLELERSMWAKKRSIWCD